MEDLRAMAPAMLALIELTAEFAGAYRAEKLRLNAADFSDQEHLALRLLVSEDGRATELGQTVAARYREILVDEYRTPTKYKTPSSRQCPWDGQNIFTRG